MIRMKIDNKIVQLKNGEFQTNDDKLKVELAGLRDKFMPEIMPSEGSTDVALAKRIVLYCQDYARYAEIMEVKLPKPTTNGIVY